MEKKNILIIGQGGAACALAKKLRTENEIGEIYIAPGINIENESYKNIDIREDDLTGLLKFALENEIGLTIPVSEKSLNADVVSFFQSNGQNIFGPAKDACNIALNKTVCKKFLYKIHAQTSKFGVFDKIQQAEGFLKTANSPVTIKCSENNTTSSMLVCPTLTLANEFLNSLFAFKNETSVLLEEYTYGHNFSIYYITDGYSAIPIASCGEYKFMQEGDGGYLTNGMGCYTPDYKVSEIVFSRVGNIINNTLSYLDKKGTPYLGIIGVDCVFTGEDKFYINEIKPFLQDYNASAILNTIEDSLFEIFMACIQGLFADEYGNIKSNNLSSVSAVVFSRQINKVVTGLDRINDLNDIDFINIRKTTDGKYLTSKDENFVMTKTSSTLNRAKDYLYEELSEITFDGIKYRKDICK